MLNLLDLDAAALIDWFARQGEKPFRARQLLHWVHQFGVTDFDAMTDVAKSLRAKLKETASVTPPVPLRDTVSGDGTRKWLLDVGGGNAVETVYIPESGRGTLCVSSQAGCALDCAFCSTGKQGFNRNLSVGEIVGQLWLANQLLEGFPLVGKRRNPAPVSDEEDAPLEGRAVSNVVLMGMGEPLANFDNVLPALRLMLDDDAYGLSRRRVTVSTSGIVPAMDRLREECPVALAVSLHAPNDALRDRLVPINQKYPLRELLAACLRYLDRAPRDFVTFEYIMLAGVNDQDEHLRQLIEIARQVPCKYNLIPFNPFPQSGFRRSAAPVVRRFSQLLNEAGIVTTTRKTRGDDVAAACGQLAGQVRDKTRRTRTTVVPIHEVHS